MEIDLSTRILTHHWFISIVGILILCCVQKSRKFGFNVVFSAIGAILLWMFIWTLRSYQSCVILRQFIGGYWVELSLLFGFLMMVVPKFTDIVRFIVAVPIGWIAIMLWEYIYNFSSTVFLNPLLSLVIPCAGNVLSIIGNLSTILTLFVVVNWVSGKYHATITCLVSIWVLILEWSFMNSSYHECCIMPPAFSNESLTYWQWINFGISAILLLLITIAFKTRYSEFWDKSFFGKFDLSARYERFKDKCGIED